MIDKIEPMAKSFIEIISKKLAEIDTNWEQPWINKKYMFPRNISGRPYQGVNAMLTMLHSENNAYVMPVYMTFDQAKERKCFVKSGQKSIYVKKPIIGCINNITQEKISLEKYYELSEVQKENYTIYNQAPRIYAVFNIDQTNFSDVYPDKYEAIKKHCQPSELFDNENKYMNLSIEKILTQETKWICEIKNILCSAAVFLYNRSHPEESLIQIPLKEQFVSGETFYSTTLHEMAHSTILQDKCKRDIKKRAREELVAELTAAFSGSCLGVNTFIDKGNCQYIKNWLESIQQSPDYLLTIVDDVVKATKVILEKTGYKPLVQEEELAITDIPSIIDGKILSIEEIDALRTGDEVFIQGLRKKEYRKETYISYNAWVCFDPQKGKTTKIPEKIADIQISKEQRKEMRDKKTITIYPLSPKTRKPYKMEIFLHTGGAVSTKICKENKRLSH